MFAALTRWVVAIGFAFTFVAGCVGTAPNPPQPAGPTIEIASGANQSGEIGATLALPLVALVKDGNHQPMSGVGVTFEIASGGGMLSVAMATTDDLGQASTVLTLGSDVGASAVTASAPGVVNGTVSFNAMATQPTSIMFATHVKPILDANCIGCHKIGGTAQFSPLTSFDVVRYGYGLSGVPFVVPNDAGASLLAQKIQASGTMYAMLGGDTATQEANLKTITSWIAGGAMNTTVGAPTRLALVSGNNQSATVGAGLPVPLVVRVMDMDDNPVSDVWVDYTVDAGGGVLTTKSVKSDGRGEAGTEFAVGALAGDNAVTASVKNVASFITFASTGTAGTATQIVAVSGNSQTATAGSALANPLVVSVKDANGNAVSGFMVAFTAAMGGGRLSAETVVTDSLGRASTTLTVGTTAGTNTVTANATGLTGSPVTFTEMGTAGTAAKIALVSGDNQSATAGAPLTMPFVVAVQDANGNPVANTAVTFAVASGGGSLSATSVMTNAAGQAQTTLTLGPAAGANTVTATRAGLTGSPITFTATGTTGTATQIALVSGNSQSGTAGSSLAMPFVVAVKDANGNPVMGYSVSFSVKTGGGMLSPASAMTDASGMASTTLTLGSTAGANSVTANATGLTGSPVTFSATGVAGAPAVLMLVSGNNQTAKVSTALASPFVVQLKDNNGNPVAGQAVTFTVTDGGGTLSATTATTSSMGLAQATLTLGSTTGTNSVTASRSGLVPVSFTATATSGTATQIAAVSGNGLSGQVGATISPFVVVVKDASGNPVGGFSVTFAVTAGGGSISATTVSTNTTGQAQTTLTLGPSAGTNTVTANATGLTGSPITFTATATAGTASQLVVVSGDNQIGPVGKPLSSPLVVAVKDAKGNPVSGFAVTFAVASGGGAISTTSATTNSMGQAQTSLTLGSATGSNTVTAAASGLTGSPITFMATARYLTYSDDIAPMFSAKCVSCHMAGGQASYTPLTTYTQVRYGTSFSSGAALVVPGSPTTSVLVQKTQSSGSMYANCGADTATRDANAKIISDWVVQGALNTAVGAATQMVATSGNNQSGPVSTALASPFVVTVMDANMNPVGGVPVTFAVTAGGGSLSAATVATTAQGTASSKLTLGATAGTNTATATSSGLTNSPITFTATATTGYSGAPLAGSTNPFDTAALVALKAANVEPVGLSSDGEFLRRVTADLAGRLPTLAEWTSFAASTDPAKRDAVIDTLLASTDFGKHWGLDVLAAWLVVDKSNGDATATDITNFENYLIDAATNDKPLSTVVSELAQGMGTGGPAFDLLNMHQYERYKAVDRLMETFTGIPVKCARCHDSKITGPLDDPKWTMAQSHGLYKFFEVDSGEFNYYDTTLGKYVNPTMMFVVDGVSSNPSSLPLPTDTLAVRRARFAQLLTASKAFPRGTGHRIFAEVMQPLLDSNRILAQQVADVKTPEILKACSSVFTAQGTSLKGYLRVLMRSKLYQLTTKGSTTANDALLARHTLRRHAAETLQAGIVEVTNVADSTSQHDDFLSKFGYAMTRAAITERSFALNVVQPLTLLNNPASSPGKVTNTAGIIAGLASKVDGSTMTLDAAITEIFRRALTRDPTATELTSLKNELSTATTNKEKLEDVAVVVMASTEFLTR